MNFELIGIAEGFNLLKSYRSRCDAIWGFL
jgi:hypothetical protein